MKFISDLEMLAWKGWVQDISKRCGNVDQLKSVEAIM